MSDDAISRSPSQHTKADVETASVPSDSLLCPKCTGTTLWRAGMHQGRQRYKCKDCRSTSFGTPAFTSPPPTPCPRCGERAVRGGPTENRTQTYRCTACQRRFIPPALITPKHLPNGRRALCHLCGGEDLVYNGKQGTKQCRQRYKCRACQKATYGFKPRPVKALPCPYCGGRCKRRGRDQRRRPRYRCTVCLRHNINLFPSRPRAKGGHYRWRRSFCLDMASSTAITAYCNKRGMNMSQAVRAILHEAADRQYAAPTRTLRTRTPDGDVRHALLSSPAREQALHLPRRLPDLRPQAARERMSRDPEIRLKPLIYITCQVTVALDDKAYTGLLRTMYRMKLNHQQAARYLITETGKPAQSVVAVAGRDAYRNLSRGAA